MKRVVLLPCILAVFSLSAQNLPSNPSFVQEEFTAAEFSKFQSEIDQKHSPRQANALQGTEAIIGQRMSHAEIAVSQFATYLRPVFTPVAPDSNYVQFLKGTSNINIHGFSQTFDPTSVGFKIVGQSNITAQDDYILDTIYVGVRYRTASLETGLTGDTLSVAIFTGTRFDNSVWRVGIGYAPNTFPSQPSRINVLPPKYMGNPAFGVPGTIAAPNKIVVKYALSAKDTAVNFIKIVPPSPIQVTGGHKVGVFCSFIPGYTYDPLSQLYYVSGAKADVNNLSWLYYAPRSETDETPYFLEALQLGAASEGISSILFSRTRYKQWQGQNAFRNDYVAPVTNYGNLIEFYIRASTSVGLHETGLSDITIYPNPTNGKLNIQVEESGRYDLTIVNVQGQTVLTESANILDENWALDISHFPKGLYVVNLKGKNHSSQSKVMLN